MSTDGELDALLRQLKTATSPEAVFGGAADYETAHTLFKRLAKIAHGDRYHSDDDLALAHEAFIALNGWWQAAEAKFKAGTYGKPTHGAVASKVRTYPLEHVLGRGDCSVVYTSGAYAVKIGVHASVNALLQREAQTLQKLEAALAGLVAVESLPRIKDLFAVKQANTAPRAVTVFEYDPTYVPLTTIFAAYPQGLDGRHIVWLAKRLLGVLEFVHAQGIVHGAVLPTHILVNAKTHHVKLIDWCFATEFGKPLDACSTDYRGWYPPEVAKKAPASPALDLYMAALCLHYAAGADPGSSPEYLPRQLAGLLRACLLANPARRSSDAGLLYDQIDAAAKDCYGPPRFVPLVLEGV